MTANNKTFSPSFLKLAAVLIGIGFILSLGTNILGVAFANDATIEIINDTGKELVFDEIKNRQDVKIKTEPPKQISSGDTGKFTVGPGDSVKNLHLNVKYYVGSSGSSEIVGFGFKGDAWGKQNCFVDVPETISGSWSGCDDVTIKFTFKSKA